jgi:hypothetical protein
MTNELTPAQEKLCDEWAAGPVSWVSQQSLRRFARKLLAVSKEEWNCLVRTNAGHMDQVEQSFNKIKELSRDNAKLLELNEAADQQLAIAYADNANLRRNLEDATFQDVGLHEETRSLVYRFAKALADKLKSAEDKYGYDDGWRSYSWIESGECQKRLVEHIAKGDPRDVAAYCAFLWHHGKQTSPPSSRKPRL